MDARHGRAAIGEQAGATRSTIQGTSEPWTIGMETSSGCNRMLNEDVIYLHDRLGDGALVGVI